MLFDVMLISNYFNYVAGKLCLFRDVNHTIFITTLELLANDHHYSSRRSY